MPTIPPLFSEHLLELTNMSAEELRVELAVWLYAQEKISIGKATELAQTHRIAFQHTLADRGIPIHFSEEELLQDLENLKKL